MSETPEKKPFGEKIASAGKYIKKFWNHPPSENRHLSLKEMGAYGVGSMGCSFILNIGYLLFTQTLIPRFYGIPAIHGTIIFCIAAFLQLIFAPLFGNLVDNTKTKWGKVKPYFLIISPIFTVVTILASWTPQFEGMDAQLFSTIFAYATCIPALFLQQIYANLFNYYPSLMTPNSQERADMLGPCALIYSLAPTIMNAVVPALRGVFIKLGQEYMAYRISALVFTILGLLMVSFLLFFTKERVYITKTAEENKKKQSIFAEIGKIFKNVPFLMILVFSAFTVLKAVLFNFVPLMAEYKFAADSGEALQIYAGLTLIIGFGATPGMLLAPIILRKISKKKLLILANAFQGVILLIIGLWGFQNLPTGIVSILIIVLYGFLYQFANGLTLVVLPTLTAEAVDYQQYLTGDRMEGFMNTMTVWASAGIGTFLTLVPTLIQTLVIGFEQGDGFFIPSDPKYGGADAMAISNLWFNVAAWISLGGIVLSLIPLFFFKFKKSHVEFMKEIKATAQSSTFQDEQKVGEEEFEEAAADETDAESKDFTAPKDYTVYDSEILTDEEDDPKEDL